MPRRGRQKRRARRRSPRKGKRRTSARKVGGLQQIFKNRSRGRRQLPQGWTFRDQPLLCSVSDQGGINRGVLDYVQFMLPLGILVAHDSTHRCYNDLKASLRASRLFRSFLAFGVVHNINYGPAGTKTWFTRKRHALHEFCKKRSCHSNPFLSYMASICQERGEVEDGAAEQRERMWAAMKQMKGCQIHGPLTKLMRWYSWWESCKFHSGEVFFTKLLMLHGNTWEAADGETFNPVLLTRTLQE